MPLCAGRCGYPHLVVVQARKHAVCQRATFCSQVAKDKDVMVIDSRCGEDFAAFSPGGADGTGPVIMPRFDACASWWTQVSGTHLCS